MNERESAIRKPKVQPSVKGDASQLASRRALTICRFGMGPVSAES